MEQPRLLERLSIRALRVDAHVQQPSDLGAGRAHATKTNQLLKPVHVDPPCAHGNPPGSGGAGRISRVLSFDSCCELCPVSAGPAGLQDRRPGVASIPGTYPDDVRDGCGRVGGGGKTAPSERGVSEVFPPPPSAVHGRLGQGTTISVMPARSISAMPARAKSPWPSATISVMPARAALPWPGGAALVVAARRLCLRHRPPHQSCRHGPH